MTQPTTTPLAPLAGLPTIPREVQKFAEEVGAVPYLPGVLAMTRRIYPEGELSLMLIDDPEIEDYRHIAFVIDDTGWSAEQMLDLWHQWSSEIVRHCPTTHTPYFLLRL